ncbi:MAG TPA: contact-dependent growth inhibition system immunity protein [Gemmatimonadales bacterium]
MEPPPRPDVRPTRDKTLLELEGEKASVSIVDSYLVKTVRRLRELPIRDYRVEDLRLMIGQGLGLPYLVPIALEVLEANPFAKGDYYPGDLLKMVASVPLAFWSDHPSYRRRAAHIVRRALQGFDQAGTIPELRGDLWAAGALLD